MMKALSEKRILLLADVNSSHVQKWALGLSTFGFKISIFSLQSPSIDWYSDYGIQVTSSERGLIASFSLIKILYIKELKKLRRLIKEFKPHLIHSHYASSYGLLGALSGFRPFFISAWGSDILDFPNKSLLHKWLVNFNLGKCDKIFSVSFFLGREIKSKFNKSCEVIPFGVDVGIFRPTIDRALFNEKDIVIGTVKSLERIYGIDILIETFAMLYKKHANINLRLLIVGAGSMEAELKKKVSELNISHAAVFTGRIPHDRVPDYHNMIDIFANLSVYESFGVAVLEASACGKPVVVSRTGGLNEVMVDGKTGFSVELSDSKTIVRAFEELILNESLRTSMGNEGRKFTVENYDWNDSIQKMASFYISALNN